MTAHHTPERLAIIRETWGEPVHIEVILARLNATPGFLPVTGKLAAAWASQQGIRRHPHLPRRVPIEVITGPVTEPVRLAALGRLAKGDWTHDRLTRLCDGWIEGISAERIAELLGVSKNAVLGKVHRLVKRGLLHHRQSPIVSRGPREPKPPPAPRPMNAPAPLVTLPPLLSGLPPRLSTEPIYDGPPGFHFATGRPPRPTVPSTRWVADNGSWPTGPSRRPCQFVTREGSVTETWVMCGLQVARGAWCNLHRATVYTRLRAA